MGWQSHLQKTITKSNSPTHDMIHMWNNVKRTTTKFCQKDNEKNISLWNQLSLHNLLWKWKPSETDSRIQLHNQISQIFFTIFQISFLMFSMFFSFLDLLNLFLLRFLKVDELMFGEFNTTRFLKYVSFLDKI